MAEDPSPPSIRFVNSVVNNRYGATTGLLRFPWRTLLPTKQALCEWSETPGRGQGDLERPSQWNDARMSRRIPGGLKTVTRRARATVKKTAWSHAGELSSSRAT